VWFGDAPLAQLDGPLDAETPTYLHTDHLATPRLGTDQAGIPVWRWESPAFGEAPPSLQLRTVNLRFPGQYFDSETGLHYNYYRDCYDPATGRYCQPDPLGLAAGINLFSYVGGNPVSKVDPLGLSEEFPGGRQKPGPIGIPDPSAQAQRQAAAQLQKLLNRLFCDPDCFELEEAIAALAGELRERYVDMTADANNLFCDNPVGKMSWLGHQMQYNQKRGRLQRLIEQAKTKGCVVNPEDERLANTPPPICPARYGR